MMVIMASQNSCAPVQMNLFGITLTYSDYYAIIYIYNKKKALK